MMLKVAAATLVLAMVLPGAAAGHVERPEIGLALDYLRGRQNLDGSIGGAGAGPEASSAWAAIAFGRVGQDCGAMRVPGGASLLDYVVANTRPTQSALTLARQVLALDACGADPRAAAGFDAVAALRSHFDGVQLGDPTYINDDIFGLQAFAAADVPASDTMVAALRAYLLDQQQPSGAWGFEPINAANPNLLFNLVFADVDLTAQALVALVATDPGADAAGDLAVARGLIFLKLGQWLDGGCQWSPFAPAVNAAFAGLGDPAYLLANPTGVLGSNGASTSWVLTALSAMDQDAEGLAWQTATGGTPVGYLLGLQQPDGHFLYQPGVPLFQGDEVMTAFAVVGLSGHTFAA